MLIDVLEGVQDSEGLEQLVAGHCNMCIPIIGNAYLLLNMAEVDS